MELSINHGFDLILFCRHQDAFNIILIHIEMELFDVYEMRCVHFIAVLSPLNISNVYILVVVHGVTIE